mgnify:CR=1 FL=1
MAVYVDELRYYPFLTPHRRTSLPRPRTLADGVKPENWAEKIAKAKEAREAGRVLRARQRYKVFRPDGSAGWPTV